jgi:hypothetical protein
MVRDKSTDGNVGEPGFVVPVSKNLAVPGCESTFANDGVLGVDTGNNEGAGWDVFTFADGSPLWHEDRFLGRRKVRNAASGPLSWTWKGMVSRMPYMRAEGIRSYVVMSVRIDVQTRMDALTFADIGPQSPFCCVFMGMMV